MNNAIIIKKSIRCWALKQKCQCGEAVEVFFTVPDFGDCNKLFICLGCAAIFAIDPEREFYSKIPFDELKKKLDCPVCNTPLREAKPYPENYLCSHCKTIGSFVRMDNTIPPASESVIRECYDPYAIQT